MARSSLVGAVLVFVTSILPSFASAQVPPALTRDVEILRAVLIWAQTHAESGQRIPVIINESGWGERPDLIGPMRDVAEALQIPLVSDFRSAWVCEAGSCTPRHGARRVVSIRPLRGNQVIAAITYIHVHEVKPPAAFDQTVFRVYVQRDSTGWHVAGASPFTFGSEIIRPDGLVPSR